MSLGPSGLGGIPFLQLDAKENLEVGFAVCSSLLRWLAEGLAGVRPSAP